MKAAAKLAMTALVLAAVLPILEACKERSPGGKKAIVVTYSILGSAVTSWKWSGPSGDPVQRRRRVTFVAVSESTRMMEAGTNERRF